MFNVMLGRSRDDEAAADAVAEVGREGLVNQLFWRHPPDQRGSGTLQQLGISDDPSQVVGGRRSRPPPISTAWWLRLMKSRSFREQVAIEFRKIVCPGMRSAKDPTDDQRRTMSVGDAVRAGADYVVVGRPILSAEDPGKAALAFGEEINAALTNAIAMNQSTR
jgi:hypothetical protein